MLCDVEFVQLMMFCVYAICFTGQRLMHLLMAELRCFNFLCINILGCWLIFVYVVRVCFSLCVNICAFAFVFACVLICVNVCIYLFLFEDDNFYWTNFKL